VEKPALSRETPDFIGPALWL